MILRIVDNALIFLFLVFSFSCKENNPVNLPESYSLNTYIFDNKTNKPIEHALITIGNRESYSDSNGYVSLTNLDQSRITAFVSHYQYHDYKQTIDLNSFAVYRILSIPSLVDYFPLWHGERKFHFHKHEGSTANNNPYASSTIIFGEAIWSASQSYIRNDTVITEINEIRFDTTRIGNGQRFPYFYFYDTLRTTFEILEDNEGNIFIPKFLEKKSFQRYYESNEMNPKEFWIDDFRIILSIKDGLETLHYYVRTGDWLNSWSYDFLN